MKFSFKNSTQIFFGQGQIASISSAIDTKAKVLVIYGGGSIKTNGVYSQVENALKAHDWVEFSGVEVNPTKETLDKAVALVREKNIDFILAVGGGSVADGAKYVAAAAHYEGDGWDILTRKYVVQKAIALGVVLTLPATGSESNCGSVISRAATQEKLSFKSPFVQPVFAVLDPDTMKSLPKRQLVNGIVDAWVHICEQYLTYPVSGAMVQDGYAECLLKTLKVLSEHIDTPDDAWRANLMWAANQALNGLIGCGLPQDWATHMIGHELTAIWGLDHARSLAIIQPALLQNQIETKREKLEQMGINVFGLAKGDMLAEHTIAAIEAFYHELKVETRLTQYSKEKTSAIEKVIVQLKVHGFSTLGEKQNITTEKAREILQLALA